MLGRHVGGDKGIRVVAGFSYDDPEGLPFKERWIALLRATLLRLQGFGEWAVARPVYIPRAVERYERSRIPEPNASATGRWVP